jgi:hypothetical protein
MKTCFLALAFYAGGLAAIALAIYAYGTFQ